MISARTLVPVSARFCAALAAVIMVTACDLATGPGQDAPNEMLFMSTRTAAEQRNWVLTPKDIFRWNVSGGDAVNVTDSPGDYRNLSLSPDGRTVAYTRLGNCALGGQYGAWVMNVDGSDARQVAVAGFDAFRCIHQPRISPDGSRIAFTSSRTLPDEPGGWRIWIKSMSSGDAVEVSNSVGTYSWMWGWSPDGRAVFHAVGAPTAETAFTAYIVNPDGSNLQPFFPRTGDHSPSWSPDRSRIAFLSDREGSTDVYVMNADGTNERRLTDLPGEAFFDRPLDVNASEVSPWSPDGTRIAFRYAGDGNPRLRLYSVRADGTDLTALTAEALAVRNFYGWSHSGRSIAYTAGNRLHVADADGSNPRNLTTGGWMDGHALWLPRR